MLLASPFLLAAPALAVEFEPNDQGFTEFNMPSGNIGCFYVPAGGTDVYKTSDGGAELSCDRVAPSYVRVMLGESGKAERITNVGDPSCCGGDNIFEYGEVWSEGPFSCISSTTGPYLHPWQPWIFDEPEGREGLLGWRANRHRMFKSSIYPLTYVCHDK